MEELLSVPQVAAELGLNEKTIRDRIVSGAMAAQRVGERSWAITRAEVERARTMGRLPPGRKRHCPPEHVPPPAPAPEAE